MPPETIVGGEHTVHPDEISGRWWKATRPDVGYGHQIVRGFALSTDQKWIEAPEKVGGTAGEYLDRLDLHNRLFEDDVRIERVVPHPGGRLSVVTSQHNVQGRAASPEEIDETMHLHGFERIAHGMYYHPGEQVLAYDLVPRNAVFREGQAVPIDAIMQRATPDFAGFLRRHEEISPGQP